MQKKRKKIEKGLKWQDPNAKNDETKEDEEYSDSDSDTLSSYDSDDDEAHVAHHYSRKSQSTAMNKKTKKKIENGATLFKPHEIDQWDDSQIMDEQRAMMKQLAGLMMGAVAHSDMANNTENNEGATKKTEIEFEGMSHKRQNTLKTLIDVTQSPNNTGPRHELQKSLSNARKYSIGDLTSVAEEAEDEQYDPEIFKYLSELVGNDSSSVPLTPSTRSVMKDLFVDALNDDEVSLNLPEFGKSNSESASSYSGYHHGVQYSHSDMSQMSDDSKQNDEDENVMETMEQGTTLVRMYMYTMSARKCV